MLVDNDAAAEMLAAPVFAVEEGHFGFLCFCFFFSLGSCSVGLRERGCGGIGFN